LPQLPPAQQHPHDLQSSQPAAQQAHPSQQLLQPEPQSVQQAAFTAGVEVFGAGEFETPRAAAKMVAMMRDLNMLFPL
jgi:hypothetical protein